MFLAFGLLIYFVEKSSKESRILLEIVGAQSSKFKVCFVSLQYVDF